MFNYFQQTIPYDKRKWIPKSDLQVTKLKGIIVKKENCSEDL